MENPIETGAHRYQSDPGYVYANDPKARFDQKRLAAFVGYVAFGLPIVLGLGGLIAEDFRPSLSDFYYKEIALGDIFVGSLFFIGTVMLAFRGWHPKVATLASIAGLVAYFVALFPTAGWQVVDGDSNPVWAGPAQWIHLSSALVLFLLLAFFCFFVFTKTDDYQAVAGAPTPKKKLRNRIYYVSGSVILAMIAAIAIGMFAFGDEWKALKLTFWAEAVALLAFGVSWMTHGRVFMRLTADPQDFKDRAVAHAVEEG